MALRNIPLIHLSILLAASLLMAGCTPQGHRPTHYGSPDLLSTMRAPLTAGRSFSVTIRESNQGRRLAGEHVIRVYLLDHGRKINLRGGYFHVIPLAAGQSRNFRLHLQAPGNIRSGKYRLCVSTDDRNQVRESNKQNNTQCQKLLLSNGTSTPSRPRLSKPDLVNSLLAPGISDRSIPVTVRDTNQGHRRGANYHKIRIYLRKNGHKIALRDGTISAGRLQAGQTRDYRTQVYVPLRVPYGRYRLCADTDTRNVVHESNERNNTSCRPIILRSRHIRPHQPRHRPDLVSSISAPTHSGPSIPVTIRDSNLSSSLAYRHTIRIFLRHRGRVIPLHNDTIYAPDLRAREFRTYRQRVTLRTNRYRLSSGRYQLCVTTDYSNKVRERNEQNNTSCQPISITVPHRAYPRHDAHPRHRGKADLTSTIRLKKRFFTHKMKVYVTETNNGTRATGPYVIKIFLRDGKRKIALGRGTRTVSGLKPGESRTYYFKLGAPNLPGNRYYKLCIKTDAGNRVRESNERNNRNCYRAFRAQ